MSRSELDSALLPDGEMMTLRRNGDAFEIRIGLFELMSSRNPVSERAMARRAFAQTEHVRRVLIGGLGMGYTLRAALDEAGPATAVTVAELVPAVVAWNRGPLADLAGRPLEDPRASVFAGDVADALAAGPYDVILLDVDNGPDAVMFVGNAALYCGDGLARLMAAVSEGGVLAIWAADPSPPFIEVVAAAGFRLEAAEIAVTDAVRHVLYLVSHSKKP